MSKTSQRDERQRNWEESQEKERKFSSTLAEWIQVFAEYSRQDPLSETAMLAYREGLKHLSPKELEIGCKEAIKLTTYFPKVSEILEGLRVSRERTPFGTAIQYEDNDPIRPEDLTAINEAFAELGRKLYMDNAIKQKARQERKAVELEAPSQELIPTVNGVPLTEWALNQDLSDDLPRTPQEIELIKTVKHVNQRKRKRGHHVNR